MNLLLLSLIGTLAAVDSVPYAPRTVQPPAVVVHRQPEVPLVALRLALTSDDPPGYAGAGHLFQHLTIRSLEERASRVGARVYVERTPDALVYTVMGPAAELEYLAGLLPSVLRPPSASAGALLSAHTTLEQERLAEWETAPQHVRAALRARLFPSDLPAAGTPASAERLRAESLEAVWAEMYHPDRVQVTAVGDVRVDEVRAALGELPPPPPRTLGPAERDTAAALQLAPAEATQAWLGQGYLAAEVEPAALSVAAYLLERRLQRRLPDATVAAEHWWTHHGQALALVVALPGSQMSAAQRALDTAVAGLRDDLALGAVRDAAAALRRDMLFYARTPDRMADVLGQFTERAGDPGSAQHFYGRLEDIGAEQVEDALERLAAQSPVRIRIPPQELGASR